MFASLGSFGVYPVAIYFYTNIISDPSVLLLRPVEGILSAGRNLYDNYNPKNRICQALEARQP